jgi:DNA modification methylase
VTVELKLGDCLEVLRALPDCSVDAVVTDPPYGLAFMGKKWDYDVPSEEIWRECLRVLKPGGHLLAFAGTRTQHRMAVRIEDAGFEIRDMIAWVYGSGFPKSLDVSKAIDKQRAEDVEPAARVAKWLCDRMDERRITRRDLCKHFDAENIAQQWTTHWTDGAVKPRVPKWHQWQELKALLSFGDEMDSEVWRLNGRKGRPGDAYAERPDAEYSGAPGMRESWTGGKGWSGTTAKGGAGVTAAARQWQGWGTALKPALEPITVARKPLAGTVAETVLAHGTGGINVDGCRVEAQDGRWPANLIHDGSDDVVGLFPNTTSGSRKAGRHVVAGGQGRYGEFAEGDLPEVIGDSGSAARFFYCAKASKADRGDNHHPTVKPTALMRYLCRLVTPPGGVVLDPFMGSGSTGKACALEGFRFIGIERESEYLEIARARIEAARNDGLFCSAT